MCLKRTAPQPSREDRAVPSRSRKGSLLSRRNMAWLLVLGAGVLALAGCGSSATVPLGGHAVGHGRAPSSKPSCGSLVGLVAKPLPAGFHPVAVYECDSQVETIPGRGQWLVRVERKATRDFGRLLAALRRSNASEGGNMACLADLIVVAPFALVGRDRQVVRPAVPTDACGQPQIQTRDALKALRWVTVSSRPIRQIETQAELASGCGSSWDDLFREDASDLQPAAPGAVFKRKPAALTVCVFRDPGNFVRGGRISGAAAARVLHGISGGRRSPACTRRHAMFAVLWPRATGQTGPTAYVELGGCDRVLRIVDVIHRSRMIAVEHDEIGQASPAAIRVIEHVGAPASHQRSGF